MNEQLFKDRTKKLGLAVIQLVEALPTSRTVDIIARQLLRSATSVGANYRAAGRGKSSADVIAKLAIGEEEADEANYWLELLVDAKFVPLELVAGLLKESNEIVAMTVASIKTLRARNWRVNNPKSKTCPELGRRIKNPK